MTKHASLLAHYLSFVKIRFCNKNKIAYSTVYRINLFDTTFNNNCSETMENT